MHRLIRDVPNFPKPGIVFKDITPLLGDKAELRYVINQLAEPWREWATNGLGPIDYVAGLESRGFIFGMPLALELGVGFIPIRKPGKLPAETLQQSYALEYGKDVMEIHADACPPVELYKGGTRPARVLICDDLLATGGSAVAATELIRKAGAHVMGYSFLIELTALEGRHKLRDAELDGSLIPALNTPAAIESLYQY